jgi:hypothetical protein
MLYLPPANQRSTTLMISSGSPCSRYARPLARPRVRPPARLPAHSDACTHARTHAGDWRRRAQGDQKRGQAGVELACEREGACMCRYPALVPGRHRCPTVRALPCPLAVCPLAACPLAACARAACPLAACPLTACARAACPLVACPLAACPLAACPRAACPRAACPLAACPLAACPLAACPLAVCPLAACPLAACPRVMTSPCVFAAQKLEVHNKRVKTSHKLKVPPPPLRPAPLPVSLSATRRPCHCQPRAAHCPSPSRLCLRCH